MKPIIVEQSFSATKEAVWKAITDHDLMVQWYFENIPAFEAVIGFKTQFNVESNGKDFFHLWEVTEVVPTEKIAYTWQYANYPGDSVVEFEIIDEEHQTTIRLSASGIESFPQDIPEFKRESCLEGWNYFIKQRLKEFLDLQE